MKSQHLVRLAFLGVMAVSPMITAHTARAQVGVSVGISLPPIQFVAAPELVVLPGSYVYVAPDLAVDLYFVDGWWWRPWQGHWYRSHSYDNGWGYYGEVPSFYGGVDHGWRDNYRDHHWQGQSWNYERMPQQRVVSNWSSWRSTNYWQSHQSWGVQGMNEQHGNRAPAREERRSGSSAARQPREAQAREAQPRVANSSPQRSEHHSTPSQARTTQGHASPSRAQPSQHRTAQPKAQAHPSQQPVSEKGNGGQPHGSGGGNAEGQAHGSPDHGNGKK
jgi:hypothetical protein